MNRKNLDRRQGVAGQPSIMVERKEKRRVVTGFSGDIAGSDDIVAGDVGNISAGGFKITGIPDSFTGAEHSYTTVLNGNGSYYRVVATPRWRKECGEKGFVEMGFKILDAPWEWLELNALEE